MTNVPALYEMLTFKIAEHRAIRKVSSFLCTLSANLNLFPSKFILSCDSFVKGRKSLLSDSCCLRDKGGPGKWTAPKISSF